MPRNILLVYPHYPATFWSCRYAMKFIGRKASFPPLGLTTVAAILLKTWGKRLVDMDSCAQALDFLAITKNFSFPTRKLHGVHPAFPDEHELSGDLMTPEKNPLDEVDTLRHKAENFLCMQHPEKTVFRMDDKTQRLLHELQVHQIELEMQNTELRRIRDELEISLARYTDLYDFAPVGYFTISRDGLIQAVNLSGVNLLGSERSRLLGQHFAQFVTPEDRAAFAVFLKKVFTSRGKIEGSVELLNLKEQPLIVQIEAVITASMQECFFALIDITKHRQYEERLHYLSTRDALTGLFNRSFFDAELERLLDSRLYPVSVIIADVDELKKINDTYGHAPGDQMIKLAAKVLRQAVRPEDVVARIGGDEFAILLPQTTITDDIVQRMRQNRETIQCDDTELPLQLSLGAATAHNSNQLKDAMLLADLRMYEDKNHKRTEN